MNMFNSSPRVAMREVDRIKARQSFNRERSQALAVRQHITKATPGAAPPKDYTAHIYAGLLIALAGIVAVVAMIVGV